MGTKSLPTKKRPTYRLLNGGMMEAFHNSRNKIQVVGGGFANGKTAGTCIKVLTLLKDYPGCVGLMARSTYPKLNGTLRREFLKWCPQHWIKRFNRGENTIEFTNGSILDFRYVQQRRETETGDGSSNLLSATYDFIAIDQVDDPEIQYKDFTDLLGRLRGMTPYAGNDPTMPKTGPRWFIMTYNPTRNWLYRNLVAPLLYYQKTGKQHPELLVDPRTGKVIIDLFEGSTYENADNLEEDYISSLEATYRGQMRERFLLGKWSAYEGLVYPSFDETTHVVSRGVMEAYHKELGTRFKLPYREGYDFGIAVQSCYILAFEDPFGNIHLLDGFYEKEKTVDWQTNEIKVLRRRHAVGSNRVHADPDIFRRKSTVGPTVSQAFLDGGVNVIRGSNDIKGGIEKINSYLHIQQSHLHPYTLRQGAPFIYVSDHLTWFVDEISDYYWKRNERGEYLEEPMDRKDHAMDTFKYLMTEKEKLAVVLRNASNQMPAYMLWHELDSARNDSRMHRHR